MAALPHAKTAACKDEGGDRNGSGESIQNCFSEAQPT